MRNARVIRVTSKNAHSGKVSLQKSDVVDFIEGKLQLLFVINEGQSVHDGAFYEGETLNNLMASAISNGPIFSRDSEEIFYLAAR